MTIFRTQVNYRHGATGKWSNVWHNEAADIPAVLSAWTSDGVPDLLPLLANSCTLHSLLVSDPLTDEFVTLLVDASGTSSASGDLLPLFNSLRAFFSDGSLGRQDNKFFKGYLQESATADGVISSGVTGGVVIMLGTLIADMSTAGAPLVSTQGDPYVSASVQAEVQMRQMHRKRKKAVPAP